MLGRTSTLVLVLTDRGDLLACPLDGDEPVWRIRVPAPDPAHPARVADMLLETWSATVTDCRCY